MIRRLRWSCSLSAVVFVTVGCCISGFCYGEELLPYVCGANWQETVAVSRPLLRDWIQAEVAQGGDIDEQAVWKAFWERCSADFLSIRAENLSEYVHEHAGTSVGGAGREFHVSLAGSDTNPGSAAAPFRTLARAQAVIRQLKRTEGLTKPIHVMVHGGVHYLDDPLRFGVEDSGTAACPIVWEAASGERVVLSAGRKVHGPWTQSEDEIWYTDIAECADPEFGRPVNGIVSRFDAPGHRHLGEWVRGEDWLHDGNTGKGEKSFTFNMMVTEDGTYDVYTSWRAFGNRSGHIPVTIQHAGGESLVTIDQTVSGDRHLLGKYHFVAGSPAQVTFSNKGTKGYVAVYQVELVRTGRASMGQPWRFRQLFVAGTRETLARFPNTGPSATAPEAWLAVAPGGQILAGLGQTGDWAEYEVNVPRTGAYDLWVGVATVFDDPQDALGLFVDEAPTSLMPIRKSSGWRDVAYSRAAELLLTEGRHILRWESRAPRTKDESREVRVHLDRFVLTTSRSLSPDDKSGFPPCSEDEVRICVEAEDSAARIGGESQMGFQVFPIKKSLKDRFQVQGLTRAQCWQSEPHPEVFMFVTWGWFNMIAWLDRIVPDGPAYDYRGQPQESCTFYLRGREANSPIWPGNRFYVFNARCELDAPGEWFLDYRSGRLSYLPRPGDTTWQETMTAPRLTRLIEMRAPSTSEERVSHIVFRGFEFRHTDATSDHPAWRSSEDCAILMENCWNCAIEDCHFENIGGYGIRLSLDSCFNRISGNTISRAGAGGIILRGPWVGWGKNTLSPEPEARCLAPIGNWLHGNEVHHCGELKKYVAGIHIETRPKLMRHAPGNVYSKNYIHHMPRSGIFGFRNLGGYVMKYNHIHDVLQESDDGGLIHVCTAALNDTSPAIIRNNLLHDAVAYRHDDVFHGRTGLEARSNGHGVYLDGETSYVTVAENVISNTRKGCVFLHSGEHNTVVNNVLLNDRRHQFWQTKTWAGNTFTRNLVVWSTDTPWAASLTTLPKEEEGAPGYFGPNMYWHDGKDIEIEGFGSFADWRGLGFDAASLVVEPRIVEIDLPKRVFRLSPESPVFSLGFHSVDISRCGVQ